MAGVRCQVSGVRGVAISGWSAGAGRLGSALRACVLLLSRNPGLRLARTTRVGCTPGWFRVVPSGLGSSVSGCRTACRVGEVRLLRHPEPPTLRLVSTDSHPETEEPDSQPRRNRIGSPQCTGATIRACPGGAMIDHYNQQLSRRLSVCSVWVYPGVAWKVR
jgi:hypothetical protein